MSTDQSSTSKNSGPKAQKPPYSFKDFVTKTPWGKIALWTVVGTIGLIIIGMITDAFYSFLIDTIGGWTLVVMFLIPLIGAIVPYLFRSKPRVTTNIDPK